MGRYAGKIMKFFHMEKEIMLMKINRLKREPTEVREIISVDTTKYHDLVTNNEYIVSRLGC